MAHFFDGDPYFLKNFRIERMVKKSFEKEIQKNIKLQNNLSRNTFEKKTTKQAQEKNFEHQKNR